MSDPKQTLRYPQVVAEDLDAPTAVQVLTTWAAHTVTDMSEPGAGDTIRVLADAALGLEL